MTLHSPLIEIHQFTLFTFLLKYFVLGPLVIEWIH
jgi:hypothetical protein